MKLLMRLKCKRIREDDCINLTSQLLLFYKKVNIPHSLFCFELCSEIPTYRKHLHHDERLLTYFQNKKFLNDNKTLQTCVSIFSNFPPLEHKMLFQSKIKRCIIFELLCFSLWLFSFITFYACIHYMHREIIKKPKMYLIIIFYFACPLKIYSKISIQFVLFCSNCLF